jgi:uncharacterized protein YjbJ (UPF0337 family)
MNDDIVKGQWKQMRGDVRTNFGKLTDDDMEQINGNMESLMGKIQERYGYTKEQAKQEWDQFWNNFSSRADQAGDRADRAY